MRSRTLQEADAALSISAGRRQFLHHLIDGKTRRLLSRWVILERRQKLANDRLCGDQEEYVIHQPVIIGIRGDIGTLVGVGPQIEDLRNPQVSERLGPELKCAPGTLF